MIRAYPFLLSIAFLLSACSGSNSGFIEVPGVSPPPPPPPPPVGGTNELVVSSANAKPAARAAYGSTVANLENGGMAGGGGLATSAPGGIQKPQIDRTIDRLATRAALQLEFGPLLQPCLSGDMSISGDLLTGVPYSVGDVINVDATDCDEGLGEVINGRMQITITEYIGSIILGPTYAIGMSVQLVDFEVATASDTFLSNGDSAVTVDTTGDPLVVMSISGVSLTTVSNAGTETVSDFQTTQTVDTSVVAGSEPYTLDASGTIDSTQLGGEISYTTPVTFQGAGPAYPFAGEMLITGANNATIRLIALTESTVQIEIDADGDGVVDVDGTEITTWDDIAL